MVWDNIGILGGRGLGVRLKGDKGGILGYIVHFHDIEVYIRYEIADLDGFWGRFSEDISVTGFLSTQKIDFTCFNVAAYFSLGCV